MTEKPTIDKVTLVPDQTLTPQEKQGCIAFLTNYEPKIIWEVGQKVTAYLGTKIIELYIRSTDPRTVFIGLLAPDGEIHIAEHQQLGEPPQEQTRTPPPFTPPRTGPTEDPILTVHRLPPGMEIQIKIKSTKE